MKQKRRDFITDGALVLGLGGLWTLGACSDDDGGVSDAGLDADASGDTSIDGDSSTDANDDVLNSVDSGNVDICAANESLSVTVQFVGHTHTVTITESDLNNGNLGPYTLVGGHTHTVTFTNQQILDLRLNGTVTIPSEDSTGGPHEHDVVVQCIDNTTPPIV